MKKRAIDDKTIDLVTKIALVIAILLLAWFVFDSYESYKSGRCNSELQFKKIGECSEQQCELECAIRGFDGDLMAHEFTGKRMLISEINGEVVKEEMCVCQCAGCKEI